MKGTNEDQEPEYKPGFPELPGWYDVLVDGEPDRLRFWRCRLSGRGHWIDLDGKYIEALHTVTWTGEPTVQP